VSEDDEDEELSERSEEAHLGLALYPNHVSVGVFLAADRAGVSSVQPAFPPGISTRVSILSERAGPAVSFRLQHRAQFLKGVGAVRRLEFVWGVNRMVAAEGSATCRWSVVGPEIPEQGMYVLPNLRDVFDGTDDDMRDDIRLHVLQPRLLRVLELHVGYSSVAAALRQLLGDVPAPVE